MERGLFMITVAICDDEKQITSELEQSLLDIFRKMNIKYEIDVFYTGVELCTHIKSTYYDLIFLDIEFDKDELNGIEVGKLIRNTHANQTSSIIYISWEMKYAMELFDIRPFNFLIKPLDDEKIEQIIRLYLQLKGQWTEVFTYKSGHHILKAQMKDIVYLESNKRKVTLHLTGGQKEEFYGTLKEAYQNQLQRFDFLLIHAAYIVNYDHVAILKYDVLVLTDGTSLPISRHRRKEIGKAYYDIIKRRSAQ